MGKQQKLRLARYTTNVTLLTNGTTIHSLLRLSIDKHTIINKPNSIINIWPNIQFIIIDEISMVGCILLFGTIHLKLQKNNLTFTIWRNQHNVHVGDFLQFSPINDTPLYSINIQPIFTFTKSTQYKFIGKSLWENYIQPNSIILIEKTKEKKYIQYATLLKKPLNKKHCKIRF